MADVKQFTISRSRWFRGTEGGVFWDTTRKCGCVLGHYLHACGVPYKVLAGKTQLDDLSKEPKQAQWLHSPPKGVFGGASWWWRIMDLNDSHRHVSGRSISLRERERRLVSAFRRGCGIELTFVD